MLLAALGLYQSLKFALPVSPISVHERVSILSYGGSTATGKLAVRFAKLFGYEVLSTCSPRNLKQVKEFGADMVFECNRPNTADAIREQTKDGLTLVFDTISSENSASSAMYCGCALSVTGM